MTGTPESSNCIITLRPDTGNGIETGLQSDAKEMFGDTI